MTHRLRIKHTQTIDSAFNLFERKSIFGLLATERLLIKEDLKIEIFRVITQFCLLFDFHLFHYLALYAIDF